jgi:hypothetical protein
MPASPTAGAIPPEVLAEDRQRLFRYACCHHLSCLAAPRPQDELPKTERSRPVFPGRTFPGALTVTFE